MDIHQPYCLVLGGGGAKGVFHIGVWQALQELEVPVNAIIGNSIGAVVAAYLVQGAEDELLKIAHSWNLKSLIRFSPEAEYENENAIEKHTLQYWQSVYKNLIERKGIDTSPMRKLLESTLDEDKIRQSTVDFGVTTVNLSNFKPRQVFVDQMDPGNLIKYVMASAAFPGFERPEINGDKYIDGGLFDNIPYAMAKRRGYRKIILVDISGIGFSPRPKTEGTQTVYIKNSIDMGNAFDFNPEFIRDFWQLGYLETMRAFGTLVGYDYFIEPNSRLESEYANRLSDSKFKKTFEDLQNLFPDTMKHDRRHLLRILEVCANLTDLPRIKRYSYESIQRAINHQISITQNKIQELLTKRGLTSNVPTRKLFDAFAKDILQSRKLKESPYYYFVLIRRFKTNKTLQIAEATILKLNPKLAILDFYITELTSLPSDSLPIEED